VTDVVLYFQVHQPYRLAPMRFFEVGQGGPLFDDGLDREVMRKVAERCYLPVNALLAELIDESDGRFRCSFSISGTALEQMEAWAPEVIESFAALFDSGAVELLCETSHHSLAAVSDAGEFRQQVELQRARLERLFGACPTTFRNTELILSDTIAHEVEAMGFDLMLGEGIETLLDGKSEHKLWRARGCERLALLLRDYEFSDDIAFRFSNKEWDQYPLFAPTYASWLHQRSEELDVVGLFMDYETFGEHQSVETGILDFMRHMPGEVLKDERFRFSTPAEALARNAPAGELGVPRPFSWADAERDLSAWLGNPLQDAAHSALWALRPQALAAAAAGRPALLDAWRRLTTSDHVYYMCTKHMSDQDVHEYFNPHGSPHEAFVRFMNVLEDFRQRLEAPAVAAQAKPEP